MVERSASARIGDRTTLRLRTLLKLRWLAVAGQLAAVAAVAFVLDFPLPLFACGLLITFSALVNLALHVGYPPNHRLEDRSAAVLLGYDILQLAALLYFTGGLQNPFALMFLAPVLISATALRPRRTVALGLLALVCLSALALYREPLPWTPGEVLELPSLYVGGLWLALVLAMAFIGLYSWRVSEEARQMADALAATELVLAREQNLIALDGLAAAAAHQLGTPLATIALVVRELERMPDLVPAVREDVLILKQQTERCREILGKIASLGEESAGPLEAQPLDVLLHEAAQPSLGFGARILVTASGEAPAPVVARNPAILYGLGNLIENAADFALAQVDVRAEWTAERVGVVIRDDGPGFPSEVLDRLGEPYLTTRRLTSGGEDREDAGGLGLGLFIAKTLLERTGATMTIRNLGAQGGAMVRIEWSRRAIDAAGAPQPPGADALRAAEPA